MLNLFFSCKPYRASILFFFSSCILLSSPFWQLKQGVDVLSLILHLWLVLYIIVKKQFFSFNYIFKEIAKSSKSLAEFQTRVRGLLAHPEHKKLCFWLEISLIWSVLSIIQFSMS